MALGQRNKKVESDKAFIQKWKISTFSFIMHIKPLTDLLQTMVMVAASSLSGSFGDSYHNIPLCELNKYWITSTAYLFYSVRHAASKKRQKLTTIYIEFWVLQVLPRKCSVWNIPWFSPVCDVYSCTVFP